MDSPKKRHVQKCNFQPFDLCHPTWHIMRGQTFWPVWGVIKRVFVLISPSPPVDTKGPVPVLREVSPPQKNDEGAGRHHRESGQNSTSWEWMEKASGQLKQREIRTHYRVKPYIIIARKIFVIEGTASCGTQILTKYPGCTFSNMAWWVALCTLV